MHDRELFIDGRWRAAREGRRATIADPATGEPVDNCQHVSMACCTNLSDFCRRVGTLDLFRREREITFLGPDGRLSRLRAGALPPRDPACSPARPAWR